MGTSSSTSESLKVIVRFHPSCHPFVLDETHVGAKYVDLVGKHGDILRIAMEKNTIRYPLANILSYETIEVD